VAEVVEAVVAEAEATLERLAGGRSPSGAGELRAAR
jgi:hypothetical protein